MAGVPLNEHEHQLPDAPSDGISAIVFARDGTNRLLVSSWDSSVSLYEVDPVSSSSRRLARHSQQAPVLGCTFGVDGAAYSGGVDKSVRRVDLTTGTATVLGEHSEPIRWVGSCAATGTVVSGSWDKTLRFWDARLASGGSSSPVATASLPGKVFSADCVGHRVIVATSGRHIVLYDARRPDRAEQQRTSYLKYQSRCVRLFPDLAGYAISSIEGRVAIEYLDGTTKPFAFKCHRKKVDGVDRIYPVNAVAFHPVYGTFATGGCDSIVNVWDGQNKKRLCQLHPYSTSIAALDFSHDGGLLAIANSYTFEEGDKGHPPDAIIIRRMGDADTRPKPKKPT